MPNEFLVIRLDPAPRETASWTLVDESGVLLGSLAHGLLEEASVVARGRQVIVLVPATDVLRVNADVPVKGGSRLLQALPFALEEQLADDVDELHFAAGARGVDGRVPVSVVRRTAMENWKQRLAAAGIEPQLMYGEGDAIGRTPNTTTLLLQEDCAVLADPDGGYTAMDLDSAEGVVELWLAQRESADQPVSPLHLVVYGTPPALERIQSGLERLRARVESLELRALTDGPLPRLAAQIVTSPGINLLQGAYSRRSTLRAFWPAWRVAASLLVAVCAMGLVVQLLEIRRLRHEVAAVDASIDQAFHYVFPDAGPVGDPRNELSSRLRQLGERNAAAPQEFLNALDAVARAFAASNEARIEAFSYRPGSMELRVRAPSVEILDRIQQAVTGSGNLKAQIQSANSSGSEVIGRLQITRSGG